MSSSSERHTYTSRQPPPCASLRMQGSPTWSTMPCQSSGNSRLRRLSSCLMPGTYCLFGSTTVFGLATPSFDTSDAPKNLSSAVHMNGLLMTVEPASTACLRYERYIGTSCEMRSTITSYGTASSCAGAPIFTNSTVTPSSRFWTASMSAGGKDHSRPTIRPTRYERGGFAERFAMVKLYPCEGIGDLMRWVLPNACYGASFRAERLP